jgi:hypothetical protein
MCFPPLFPPMAKSFSHIPIDKFLIIPIVPMIPIPSVSFHQITTKEEEKKEGVEEKEKEKEKENAS